MTSFFRTEKKDKAQQKDGFHSSVFSEETATTPYIEGMLQKKNPYGMMQVRFFYLNNGYLIYKKNKTDREVKGVIDLSETTEFTIKMDRVRAPSTSTPSLAHLCDNLTHKVVHVISFGSFLPHTNLPNAFTFPTHSLVTPPPSPPCCFSRRTSMLR